MLKTLIKKSFNAMGFDLHRIRRTAPSSQIVPAPLILPTIPIGEIVNGDLPIFILEPEQSNGNVSLLELLVINSLVAKRAANVLFEIGTFDGRSAMNMAANAAKDAVLYTLDLPKNEVEQTVFSLHEWDKPYINKAKSGGRFSGTRYERQITQLFGDSAKFDFSPYQGKAEVIFIDGSHAYEYVKNDTAVALKLASDSALVIWHDYDPSWSGVVQALEEFYASGGTFKNLRNVAGTTLAIMEISR